MAKKKRNYFGLGLEASDLVFIFAISYTEIMRCRNVSYDGSNFYEAFLYLEMTYLLSLQKLG